MKDLKYIIIKIFTVFFLIFIIISFLNSIIFLIDYFKEYPLTKFDSIDIKIIIMALFPLIIIFTIILIESIIYRNTYICGTKRLRFNKGIRNVKKAPYFRNIPCNKNIFEIYWLANVFGLIENRDDFLVAILLKWLKDNNIKINSSSENGEISFKFNNKKNLTILEVELYDMMVNVSKNKILEEQEFIEWCEYHYSEINDWFNKVIDNETTNYINNGLIFNFGKKYFVKDELKKYGIQISGFKNFLNDFSNLKNKKSIEVTLWEEYLICAQIFGIADKVAKELKNFYPDDIIDEIYDDFESVGNVSHKGLQTAYKLLRQDSLSNDSSSRDSSSRDHSSSRGGSGSFGRGKSGGGGFR